MEVPTQSTKKAANAASINWQQEVLGNQGEGILLIEQLSERRFNRGPLAEEATNYVIAHMSENNWARCQAFKGNSQPKTFARRLIINLLEEFSRKRFGRPRPPTWLQRQGEIWVKIWSELCLERQLMPALIDRYCVNGLYQQAWVKKVCTVIKARIPNCGQVVHEAETVDDIAYLSDQTLVEDFDNPMRKAKPMNNIEINCGYNTELNAQAEVLLLLKSVFMENIGEDFYSPSALEELEQKSARYKAPIDAMKAQIVLSDEETVMLRMIFRDGVSRTTVANALGLTTHQVHSRMKRTMERIAKTFESNGLELDTLLNQI